MANTRFQEFFSKRFRALLSNEPSGNPPWLEVIAAGDTGGLFMPTDAPWVVHRDFGTLVGGIRALLVQALHPGPVAGVTKHSRYQQDALGRLAGTIRWLTVTTFGSFEAAEKESMRVNRLHDRVKGTFDEADGRPREFKAADEDLLLWVHIAFTESFLIAHQMYSARELPGGADAYVSQWSRSVAALGLTKCPMTFAELEETIQVFADNGSLRVDKNTKDVIKFIKKPGLPWYARGIYRVLFAGAVVSLTPVERELLQLKTAPRWLVIPATRFTLRAVRWIIGPDSPIEDGALRRLRRVGLLDSN